MNFNFVEKFLKSFDKGVCPGCALMVVYHGKPVFIYTVGYADLENKLKINNNTDFRLCSVTKEFTAMAVMILVEKKILDINDTLNKFFPNFPEYGKNITIYQLLTHSSGLKDYEDLIPKKENKQIHDEGVLFLLQKETAGYFISGSKYRYSNGGYCLLRLIIEIVSKKSFPVFLKEYIFIPLGMCNTLINEEGITRIPNRAYGYSKINKEWVRTDQSVTSATIGDGGEYSNLIDLYKWDQCLYGKKLISYKSLENMFSKNILTDEESLGVYYGFGFFVKDHKGERVIYHGGDSVGFRTGIYRIPKKELSVIFLSNRNEGNGLLICEKVINEILKNNIL